MATQHTRSLGRLAVAPSVIVLLLWMIVPLAMTIWFSFLRYNLLQPNPLCTILSPDQLLDGANRCMAGFGNYKFFLTEYSDLFLTMGQNLFKGLATILIVWFGIKAALSSAEDGEGFAFSKFATLILMISFTVWSPIRPTTSETKSSST